MRLSKKDLKLIIESYLKEVSEEELNSPERSDPATAVDQLKDKFKIVYDKFLKSEESDGEEDDISNNPEMVLEFRKWFSTKMSKKEQKSFFIKKGMKPTNLSTTGKYSTKFNKHVAKAWEVHGEEFLKEKNISLYGKIKKYGKEYLEKAGQKIEDIKSDSEGKKIEGKGAAIYISFSDVKPISSMAKSNPAVKKFVDNIPQGHAGVILIEETGAGHYFDFGRYGKGKNCQKKEGKYGLGAIGVTGNVRYASLGKVKYKNEADLSKQVKKLVSRANSKLGHLKGTMLHTTRMNLNGVKTAVSKGLEILKTTGNCHNYSVTRLVGGKHGISKKGSYQFNCGTFSTYLFGISLFGSEAGGDRYISVVGGLGAPDSIVSGIAKNINREVVTV